MATHFHYALISASIRTNSRKKQNKSNSQRPFKDNTLMRWDSNRSLDLLTAPTNDEVALEHSSFPVNCSVTHSCFLIQDLDS